MKKTLSLLLALVMVISLFPGFADEKATLTAEEAGAVLQGYGAIKGGSDGNLMIDKELKRQDAVVILTRLMGKEADALATQAAPSFEDITIDYYKPFLAFAEANKWVEGKAEKKFGFNDVVTVKEFTAMLLRALGHDTMGENYAKVMDLAKEQGLFQGVMAEEAAPVIRGVAFIMMNNTLETAPKGEKQALVYKLGYKEMPKPENLTVVSAEAAGLKAIDVKFSKDVDENSLSKIVVKNNKNKKVTFKSYLMDSTTGRLVLDTVAMQDAKYSVVVENVKSVDGKEMVEKFEGTVFMTDATRPEVLSVEALNPKTLVIKVTEPINKEVKNFATVKEIKVDGKAVIAKVMSHHDKNLLMVELYSALKTGDHKVEITSLKDFAGFIAKTMEFDITVAEDKDAPVLESATMETTKLIKVVFNEPLASVGQFKVDGTKVTKANTKQDAKDKKVVLLTVPALNMSALTEIKVEYKDQKDIMGNMVKEFVKFTFKVEDDTTLPEVKSVAIEDDKLVVTFTKKMANVGKYTIKKDKVVKATGTPTFELDDASVLKIDISSIINGQDAADYTLILEGFKDGTVRKNELAKYEGTFSAEDSKAPEVSQLKYDLVTADGMKIARLYFSESMDEETLLNKANYTFANYDGNGKKRADASDVAVNIETENLGKEVVITFDEKITQLGNITVSGLKDKAGNLIAITEITVGADAQAIEQVLFEKNSDDEYTLKATFKNPIRVIEADAFELKTTTHKAALLYLGNENGNDKVHIFRLTDEANVTPDGKYKTEAISLNVKDGTKAKDAFGQVMANNTAEAAVDKVKPELDLKDGEMITAVDDPGKMFISIKFKEDLHATVTKHVVTAVDKDGNGVSVKAGVAGNLLKVEKNDGAAFTAGTYKITIVTVQDLKENVSVNVGTVDVEVK